MIRCLFLFSCVVMIQCHLLAAEKGVNKTTCTTSSCHDNLSKFAHIHRPLKADGCTVCHQVKAGVKTGANGEKANHPQLIKIERKNVNKTCIVCHDDKVQGKFKLIHGPIEKNSCVECHNPHGSENEKLLKQKMPELCIKCHESKQTVIDFGHGPIYKSKKSCLNCHASHFANHQPMLQLPLKEACFQCHDKEQKSPKGATITAVGQTMKSRKVHHKPAEEGKCSKCHDPHGSQDEAFLMDDPMPPKYPLCVSCHKKPMIEEQTTSTATQFRNGTTNLHYLHLNNTTGKTGPRSCFICHEPHASNQPHLIRDQMEEFGVMAPIQYRQNENGGSCAAACHGVKTYDRVKEFQNPKGR